MELGRDFALSWLLSFRLVVMLVVVVVMGSWWWLALSLLKGNSISFFLDHFFSLLFVVAADVGVVEVEALLMDEVGDVADEAAATIPLSSLSLPCPPFLVAPLSSPNER